jgi:fused signal recognition particle receptor
MADTLKKWKDGLLRTRDVTFGRISSFFGATQINQTTWDELETLLIQADIGMQTSLSIIEECQQEVQKQGYTKTDQLSSFVRQALLNRLDPRQEIVFHEKPAIILLVGVNGSGKTTTAAKLAYLYKQQQKKTLLIAADTYRAAAIDQLRVWCERLDVPLVAGQQDGDPGAVTYDGIVSGISRNMDIIIVDTAGRLHTRYNLMEEIKKVYRVANKAMPGAPHASWLVLDATTGQNALQQARAFKDAVNLTGVILTKLDSSAKGGMAFAVKEQVGLPILYAGLGEKLDDLQVFDRQAFVDGIFNT